jgi:HEAT repeat protein
MPGPARVVATVLGGEVTRLRTYVGPVRTSDVRTLDVSAADARAWLTQLVSSPEHTSARAAQDAMLPLVLADAGDPSAILLSVARDDKRPTNVRRTALTYVSSEVSEHLGIADAHAETDDDEIRRQAVFALSQQGHGRNSAELMEVARSSNHPAARRDAIFWLGQTGDVQTVAELYADLLRK